MKRKTLLVVLSAFFFFNVCGQNQRLVFHHITSEQGLSQDNGKCIGQDHKGFMWFGTNNGLNKYDGEKITVYKNDSEDSSSLSNNRITAIYEDKDRNLWVGTRGGLDLYNRDMDTSKGFAWILISRKLWYMPSSKIAIKTSGSVRTMGCMF